jgi:hypothetical protein
VTIHWGLDRRSSHYARVVRVRGIPSRRDRLPSLRHPVGKAEGRDGSPTPAQRDLSAVPLDDGVIRTKVIPRQVVYSVVVNDRSLIVHELRVEVVRVKREPQDSVIGFLGILFGFSSGRVAADMVLCRGGIKTGRRLSTGSDDDFP